MRCRPCGLLGILQRMAQDTRKRLSNRIRELRAKHSLTQQKLAELAELDYKSVQRLEAKKPRFYPKLDTLEKLAGALGITVSDLLKS